MDTKAKILDIAMNLNRIGNWAADGYIVKKKRIEIFLRQTTEYIASIDLISLNQPFKRTFLRFRTEYQKLENLTKKNIPDKLLWAEEMMTWGNILTHRVKLL